MTTAGISTAELFKQYLEHLFLGRRCEARELMFAALDRGTTASRLLMHIIWPAMEQVEHLYREDRISRIIEHMAARINRMVADQLHGFLARKPKSGKRMVVVSGHGETEELGAQIIADMFEGEGWTVWLLGAGVPNDEILQFAGEVRPDILCVFGTGPSGVPEVRQLVELIRGVGICDDMQVLVAGGVFNRADGLAEEVKADLFAPDIMEVMQTVLEHPVRIPKPDVPEPGRRRKRKREPAAAAAEKGAKKMRKSRAKATVKA